MIPILMRAFLTVYSIGVSFYELLQTTSVFVLLPYWLHNIKLPFYKIPSFYNWPFIISAHKSKTRMRYTSSERRALLKKFHSMDTDHNGELTTDEIKQCLKESNLPKEKLDVSHLNVLITLLFILRFHVLNNFTIIFGL